MDVFNLQAKIGLNVEEYLNGIKNAVNNSKKLVDAVNKMAEQAVTVQTQTDKAGKSMQGAAENADALGKSVNGVASPVDKMADAIEDAGNTAKSTENKADDLTDSIENEGKQTKKASTETSSFSNKLQALKNKLEIARSATKEASENVKKLREEFNKSAKETGVTSEKTKQLASALDKAENELKQCQSAQKKLNDELKSLKRGTKKAGEEAEKSGSKFEKFGEKLKSATENAGKFITAIAKVSAGVVGAAATGLTALTKQSLDAFSTYEQLTGGIEAAFEGNQKAINTVLATGKDAWKTLTMSQNEYYESFMAAYPLIKAGMVDENMAIDTTNRLMQLEADLANTFGYTAESAATAVNWALKGTYSYLDNLNIGIKGTKDGFLEAANASGLFSKEIENVEDLSTDEIVSILEHYAEAYGVLGRTREEAAKTLEGSGKALKAAWENLLTGFGREDANLSELSFYLMESVSAVASNVAPRIGQIFEGISKALPALIPKAYDEAKSLIAENYGSFISGLSTMLTSGADVVGKILDDVITVLPEKIPEWLDRISGLITSGLSNATTKLSKIGEIGGNLISLVFDGLESNLPDILSGLNDFIVRLFQQIPKLIDGEKIVSIAKIILDGFADSLKSLAEGADSIISFAFTLVSTIASGVVQELPTLLEAGADVLVAIVDGIVNNIDDLLLAAETIIKGIQDYMTTPENLEKIVETGTKILAALFTGLLKIAGSVIGFAASLHDDLGDKLKSADWLSLGGAILNGIFSGLLDIDGSVVEFYNYMVDTLSDKMLQLAEDAKRWGADMLANFIQGIISGWSNLTRAASETAQKVKNFLGFSEPKEGPLSNFHTYAPDMMELFAKGIKDNEHLITEQFDKSLGLLKTPEMTAKMTAETAYKTSGYNQASGTTDGSEAILTLLQAILQAVREGRIVAIDDAGFRTINEGLARIQRFDEGGAFV